MFKQRVKQWDGKYTALCISFHFFRVNIVKVLGKKWNQYWHTIRHPYQKKITYIFFFVPMFANTEKIILLEDLCSICILMFWLQMYFTSNNSVYQQLKKKINLFLYHEKKICFIVFLIFEVLCTKKFQINKIRERKDGHSRSDGK